MVQNRAQRSVYRELDCRGRGAQEGVRHQMKTGNCHVMLALSCGLAAVIGCSGEDIETKSSSTVTGVSQVHYRYDALGRLVLVTTADGTGVHYGYDPVGNITAIRRLAGNALNLVDFAPHTGAVAS